ncbi:MAG: MFS transporter [Gemmatales bacterium]|nr:MFS transporter [Gemmatales bacterium]MDW7994262.1 MFS transporter [Gemmatales bacterium]
MTATDSGWSPRRRAAALVLLVLINMFNYIDRYVVAAVEPQMAATFFPSAQSEELVKTRMGLLMPAFMVSYMVVAPLFGWLGDRFSRWWLVAFGLALWSLASGGSGLASSYAMLFVTRCLVGVGEGAYGPVAPTIIADLYPVRQRGRALSFFYAAIPVGSAMGYLLGGLILGWTNNWRMAFYAVVPPGLLLALFCLFFPEPKRGQTDLEAEMSNPRNSDAAINLGRAVTWRDYGILAYIPSYVLCTLGMTAMTFAVGGIAFWMPRYLSIDRQAASLDQVNVIFGGIIAASGLLATLVGGWLGDKLRTRWPGAYFSVSAVGMWLALPLFLASLYIAFPLAWAFLAASCFCLFLNTGPTNAILANVTHPSIRASAFAINIFIIHALGDVLSPAVIGFIADQSSLQVGFLVVAGFIALSGVFWLVGARFLESDTALAVPRLEQYLKATSRS